MKDFNNYLISIIDKHPLKKPVIKNVTAEPNIPFYILNERLISEHNCQPYFFTITFPKTDLSLQEEWALIPHFIQDLKKAISTYYLCVGGIFALEPHRNTTLKSKRGKNTKAGRPHVHAVLWFMHEFLSPNTKYIQFALYTRNINARCQKLNTHKDLVAAARYTIKETFNPVLQHLCQSFGWKNNCAIWINHHECQILFQNLMKAILSDANCFTDLFCNTPSTPKLIDDQIFLAQLFQKLFLQKGLALKDQSIYIRRPGTRFTWTYYANLRDWITLQFDLDLPTSYLIKLKESLSWLYKAGAKNKADITLQFFPTLEPKLYLVEFADCLYTFDTAQTISFKHVLPSTVSICSESYSFHHAPKPLRFLYLIFTLISFGEDSFQEYQRSIPILQQHGYFDNNPQPLPHVDKSKINLIAIQYEWFLKHQKAFLNALRSFGGLYHPKEHRKKNRVLYLQGPSNTFKTFLVEKILTKLVGIENIDCISRHSSRFNLANLKKNNNVPYVLIIDDLRWDTLGMPLGLFLNFLDGNLVHTERKFESAQTTPLKGTIAITSNHPIGDGPGGRLPDFTSEDIKALESRIQPVTFHNLKNPLYEQLTPEFWDDIEKEALSFSMLSNALFLARKPGFTGVIELPDSFYQTSSPEDEMAQTADAFLRMVMGEILIHNNAQKES